MSSCDVYVCTHLQKVDWQHHKRWCNHNVDAKAHQKADSGDPLMPDRFTQWQKRYSEKLSHVTHGMLEDSQLRTHFVHIRVRYVPDTSPYFKVSSASHGLKHAYIPCAWHVLDSCQAPVYKKCLHGTATHTHIHTHTHTHTHTHHALSGRLTHRHGCTRAQAQV